MSKCIAQVVIPNFHRTRQCKHNALEGSEYCGVHNPERASQPKVEKNTNYKNALFVAGLRAKSIKAKTAAARSKAHDAYCLTVVAGE